MRMQRISKDVQVINYLKDKAMEIFLDELSQNNCELFEENNELSMADLFVSTDFNNQFYLLCIITEVLFSYDMKDNVTDELIWKIFNNYQTRIRAFCMEANHEKFLQKYNPKHYTDVSDFSSAPIYRCYIDECMLNTQANIIDEWPRVVVNICKRGRDIRRQFTGMDIKNSACN